MNTLVSSGERLTTEWLTDRYDLAMKLRDGTWEAIGWLVAGREDDMVWTQLRIIPTSEVTFVAELAQAEHRRELDFSTGVGFPVETIDQLDAMVAALGMEYAT